MIPSLVVVITDHLVMAVYLGQLPLLVELDILLLIIDIIL
jgi:hypothetical protein